LAPIVSLAKAAAAGLVVVMGLAAADRLALVVITAVVGVVATVLPEAAQAALSASFGPVQHDSSRLQTPATCNSRRLAHRFLSGTINRTGPMTRFS
jgi:hypothetical protein